jgi:DNA-binding transcriptional MerR regulator
MAQLDLFGQIQEEIQEQQKIITKVIEQKAVENPGAPEKLYHTISEVAALYKVNTSLLRFWETEFPQIKLRKTGRGDRLYTKENIELIGTIYYLTKEKKFTLEGTRDYLKNKKKAISSESDLVKQLQALKSFLQELKVAFK